MQRIKATFLAKTVYIVQIFFDGREPMCAYIEENGKEIKFWKAKNFEICDPAFVNAQTAYQQRTTDSGQKTRTVDLSKVKVGDW